MSSSVVTFLFPPTFWQGILIKLLLLVVLNFINASTGQSIPSSVISSSVSNYICRQQSDYQETSQIQLPLKTRPENDDSTCGWYLWTKCPDSESDTCPSFVLKSCDEVGGGKKKGKGIIKEKIGSKPDPCRNSTEKGLPDPQIVPSMSKYPSVVTIEIGYRCQIKECAGLILDENWIIVQQSGCFFQFQPEHSDFYGVVAGERRMHTDEGTEQRRSVAEFIPHPEFKPIEDGKYYPNNIGLVRLSEPLELNENAQPIDLAAIEKMTPSIPQSNLTFVGWLKAQPMKEDEELLASLVESPLTFVPVDDCYDEAMKNDSVPRDSLTCAGKCVLYDRGNSRPSKGILYAQKNSEPGSAPIPFGLGPLNHKSKKPGHGVFLHLAPYIPWIKKTVAGQKQILTAKNPGASNPRIIRGEDAPPYKYKSMVNIEIYRSYACTRHKCGGSILNEEWFLTAAHCIINWNTTEKLRIIVGDHDVSDSDEKEQVVEIVKAVVHEEYDLTPSLNDIAVVQISPPLKFNNQVQKVTLPEASFEPQGLLTAIGWGITEKFSYPHILQQVEIPFVPLDECQKLYEGDKRPPKETQMCAGNETHGVCFGDSGGPLYHIAESGDQIVLGLVSYGGSMCLFGDKNENDVQSINPDPEPEPESEPKPFMPNVFTKVSSYLDWIRKNAKMDK